MGPFRYVACGEYGEFGRRPHFHVALFGMDFIHDRVEWSEGVQGDTLYVSKTLSNVWGNGALPQQTIGALTFESAAYIARYICGKLSGVGVSPMPLACDPDTGEFVMPNEEKLLMSRRPPIGRTWFDKYFMCDVFPHGRVMTEQGTWAPIPTAYRRWLRDANLALSMELSHTIGVNNAMTAEELVVSRDEHSALRKTTRGVYLRSKNGIFKRDVKANV